MESLTSSNDYDAIIHAYGRTVNDPRLIEQENKSQSDDICQQILRCAMRIVNKSYRSTIGQLTLHEHRNPNNIQEIRAIIFHFIFIQTYQNQRFIRFFRKRIVPRIITLLIIQTYCLLDRTNIFDRFLTIIHPILCDENRKQNPFNTNK